MVLALQARKTGGSALKSSIISLQQGSSPTLPQIKLSAEQRVQDCGENGRSLFIKQISLGPPVHSASAAQYTLGSILQVPEARVLRIGFLELLNATHFCSSSIFPLHLVSSIVSAK